MDSSRNAFERPTLHIVIAEDEDLWAQKIERAIGEPVCEWGLCKTGQFHLQIHRCPTVQDFQETVEPLLKARDLVYATLDLKMPDRRGDDHKDPRAGKRMVLWCLDVERAMPRVRHSFEFCLISAEEASLDGLYADPDLRAKLRNRGVKRVYKDEVDSGVAGDLSLGGLWPDIREFVLKSIHFCTFPVLLSPEDPEPELHPIWFDPLESPPRLLVQADKIARHEGGCLYLIFADAEGYDVDWFRLCCHLRGVKGRVRDFRKTDFEDPAWLEDFRNPPAALLLRHLEGATLEGRDLRRVMKAHQFLDGERQGLVFIQFPFFDTQLKVGGKLEKDDLEILEDCLRQIYGRGAPFPSGIGFAYADHDRLIAFPEYDKVLKPGIVRNTIAFQAHQWAPRHGLPGVMLDPEVAEVMSEIPWNEVGLDKLHSAIRVAYQTAAESPDRDRRRHITIEDFTREGIVRKQFDGERGFRVRGRRLFRLLEQNGPEHAGAAAAAEDGQTALASLEVIHELFVALERLMQLKEHLQSTSGEVRFGSGFTVEQFQALRGAHSFLRSIFHTPDGEDDTRKPTQWLHDRIEEFRPHAASPAWKHFYPGLRQRKGWLPLVEHIGFTWPFAQVPLHRAVDQYLSDSGVIYEILTDPQTVLDRHHQDLQPEWEKLEKARKDLLRLVHDREEQRRAAATYVRQHHAQPVVVHLDMPEEALLARKSPLTHALAALAYFNAYLAICENHHVFESKHCTQAHIQKVRTKVEMGASLGLLANYCRDLQVARQLEASVFRFWTADWPHRDHGDALRVAARLAGQLRRDHGDKLTESETSLFQLIEGEVLVQGRFAIEDVLRFLGVLRNTFEKQFPQAGWPHKPEMWDLMRRFVAATAAPIRVGAVGEGLHARLWSRRGPEVVALAADARLQAGAVWIFEADTAGHKPLFPTSLPDGAVIWLEPDNSVWSWYGHSRKTNLSQLEEL